MTRSEQLAALKELDADARALARKAKALEPYLPVGTDLTGFAAIVEEAAGDELPWPLIRELEREEADAALRELNSDRNALKGRQL